MRFSRAGSLILVLILAGCGRGALPTSASPSPGPGPAFRAADQDRDGGISEAELARDVAAAFAAADSNRDGFLDAGELGGNAGPMQQLDISGDGRVSFAEVMAGRLDGLAAADRDGDGRLSPDELAAAERDAPALTPGPEGRGDLALLLGNRMVGGLAASLLEGEVPLAPEAPADVAERRRADYERQSALQEAALRRQRHAQRLYEQWRQQAGGGVAASAPALVPDDAAQVVRAQRMLTVLGYFTGPADGLPGPSTRAAVTRFQTEQGLPPTGEVDMPLLERLREAL